MGTVVSVNVLVEFTSTHASTDYQHESWEFEFRIWRGVLIQYYVNLLLNVVLKFHALDPHPNNARVFDH